MAALLFVPVHDLHPIPAIPGHHNGPGWDACTPKVETKLAELNPSQTGTSRPEKPNEGSVPSHGPTFIKAVCTLVQRGSPHGPLKKMRSAIHWVLFMELRAIALLHSKLTQLKEAAQIHKLSTPPLIRKFRIVIPKLMGIVSIVDHRRNAE